MRYYFGPAGKPISFPGRAIEDIPKFLREIGLNAMEYEAVRSVRISEERARALGERALEFNVKLSLHAPYALNLAAASEDTLNNSIARLVAATRASMWMKSFITVFHVGYYGEYSRREALKRAIEALRRVEMLMETEGIVGVWLGPETMGKLRQIGSLEEVLDICKALEKARPVIDFPHLYARSRGEKYRHYRDFVETIELLERELGTEAIKPLHLHFTEVEYGSRGEIRHHPIGSGYGPSFENLARALIETGVEAVIISESPLLEKDAIKMKKILEDILSSSGSF
ncbi:MAG: deoxyribonuclease IV [Thermoprotei archaeon]|nr:MAG: deoxyribonuclease IV [Thermoprotei archaeon]